MYTSESKRILKILWGKPLFLMFSLLYFAAPLIFSINTNELYEFPKMFFVYYLSLVIFAMFGTKLLLNPKKVTKPRIIFIVFLSAFIISTLLSVHRYTSVFGYYTRFNDGLVSLLFYFGIYFVGINTFTKEDLKGLYFLVQLTTIPIFLVSIGQYYPQLKFLWGGRLQERVFATFGQPNWLAQFLVMLIPFSLYKFLNKNRKEYLFLYVLQFITLWLTFSTSGFLAFVIVAAAVTINYFKNTNDKTVKIFSKLVVIIGASLIFALTNPGIFKGKVTDIVTDLRRSVSQRFVARAQSDENEVFHTSFLNENEVFHTSFPGGNEALRASFLAGNEALRASFLAGNEVSDPGFIRLGLWRGTLDLIFSSPKNFLIGTGPETFPYVFQEFRPSILNYSSEWDFVFNKPHNYYLETWAEQGFVGLVLYLLILVYLIKKRLPIYIKLGLLGFAITNLFGWPVVSTALLFWLFAMFAEVEE